jgi:hypothetical protein
MKDYYETLTPSQKKLLKDQEQWMKDVGESYTDERTRLDAIYDIKKRFPNEAIAKDAVECGGDPAVLHLYYNDQVKKKNRKAKIHNPKKRMFKKVSEYEDTFLHKNILKDLKKYKIISKNK